MFVSGTALVACGLEENGLGTVVAMVDAGGEGGDAGQGGGGGRRMDAGPQVDGRVPDAPPMGGRGGTGGSGPMGGSMGMAGAGGSGGSGGSMGMAGSGGPMGGAGGRAGSGGAGGSMGMGGAGGMGGSGPMNPFVGGQAIVGVGYGGRRVYSKDGQMWSDVQDTRGNIENGKLFQDVAYANHLVVAVGGGCAGGCTGRIATFNGDKWTEVALPMGQSWLSSVAHGGGVWVAAGAAGPALVSTDGGKRWTATRQPLPGNIRALAYGTLAGVGMFVAVGDNGLRVRSLDGQTWTNMVTGFQGADDPEPLLGVAFGNDTVVAAGGGGRRIRSKNGIDWTDPAAGGGTMSAIVFNEGRFLAYADNAVFISLDNGKVWTPQVVVNPPGGAPPSPAPPGDPVSVGPWLGGSRLFVGVAWPGAVKTSQNGTGWATSRLASGPDSNALTKVIVVGY